MKILVIAPQPFMAQRGTPIAVRMLLETLSSRGDEADVLTFPEGEDVAIPGCRVFRVPALPGLSRFRPGFSAKKLLADAIMGPMAAWAMLRNRYDLVIGVEEAVFIAMALKPVFGVPYIADVDSSMPEQIDDKVGLPRWIRRWLERMEGMAMRNAVGAITCCRALETLVRDHAPNLPIQTLEDVTTLDPDARPEMPDDCRFDEPVVMYVGNLEPYQGVDLLMEGFAGIGSVDHPTRLVVIGGTDTQIAAGRARAAELGIAERTHFLGPRPVSDLGCYLAAAAITTSPRTQGRNTPMKIYSYLDSGKPLLATRLPTHTQVLDDEIAMLVEPTPDGIAAGLRRLLEEPSFGERMGKAARARVAVDFTPEAYRRKLESFLTELGPRLARRQPDCTAPRTRSS